MRRGRLLLLALALCLPALVRADDAKDPLRFVPAAAQVVVKLERPPALFEAIQTHELVQEAYKIAAVREFYDSTNFRRLQQLIEYFEKELGKDRNELLDALAGGGVVFAAKFEKPAAVLLAVQAKDPQLLRRFGDLVVRFGEEELDRQESKERIKRQTYQGIEAYQLGSAVAAILDGALIVTSDGKVLTELIDWQQGRKQVEPITASPAFVAARKSIPPQAHAWGWVNFEAVRRQPGFKTGFEAAAENPIAMFLFGGLYDVMKRAPSIVGYLEQDEANWHARVQLGAGREGMGGIQALVLPQDGNGTLPLLQTPRTFASLSYFMDLGEMWKHRDKIFNEKQAAELEKVEKASAKVLGSARLGELLQQAGNHHRVVVAVPRQSPYQTQPTTKIPAFAVVVDMRDPQFAKSMNFILRGAALFGTLSNLGLRMEEQQHAGAQLVCYYFREDKKYDGDANNIRFNFSPCFATVGEQFLVSSTVELGKDVIDELKRPSREPASPATVRAKLYAQGAVQGLKAAEDQVLTQFILSQALPPTQARREIENLYNLVERLGTLGVHWTYDPNALRLDVNWQVK